MGTNSGRPSHRLRHAHDAEAVRHPSYFFREPTPPRLHARAMFGVMFHFMQLLNTLELANQAGEEDHNIESIVQYMVKIGGHPQVRDRHAIYRFIHGVEKKWATRFIEVWDRVWSRDDD